MYNLSEKSKRKFDRLITDTVDRAQESYGMSFADVAIELRPVSVIGGLGSAQGSQVLLASELDLASEKQLSFVLAHELAHIAQKRNGSKFPALAHPDALEFEADSAAINVLCGNKVSIRLADASERPAYWGPLGHFYTVYYIMLKAGVDPKSAELRAFMCQLPDQVSQFDAVSATIDYNKFAPQEDKPDLLDHLSSAAAGLVESAMDIQRANPHDKFVYKFCNEDPNNVDLMEDPKTKAERLHFDKAVIKGLHCLNGQGSAAETEFRKKILLTNWDDPLLSGLALHPYGDSFAHRQIGRGREMYHENHGHALHGHSPDYISQRPDLYIQYCKSLYEAIPIRPPLKKMPFDGHVKPDLEELVRAGGTIHTPAYNGIHVNHPAETRIIAGEEAEEKAMKLMLQKLSLLSGFNNRYVPENKAAYWRVFSPRNPNNQLIRDMGGADTVFKSIKMAALRWMNRIPS